MKNKLDFYIMFYEQLALQGFQAYKDFSKRNLADICVEGYTVAHLTKLDTIAPNPFAEDVEPGTVEKIRGIFNETAASFGLHEMQDSLTDSELSVIHANLVKLRILPDNGLSTDELRDIDALVTKIENLVPSLGDISNDNDIPHDHDADLSEGVDR